MSFVGIDSTSAAAATNAVCSESQNDSLLIGSVIGFPENRSCRVSVSNSKARSVAIMNPPRHVLPHGATWSAPLGFFSKYRPHFMQMQKDLYFRPGFARNKRPCWV